MTAVYEEHAIDIPGVMLFLTPRRAHRRSALDVWDSLTFLRQAGLANAE